jgi:hypothetical protein
MMIESFMPCSLNFLSAVKSYIPQKIILFLNRILRDYSQGFIIFVHHQTGTIFQIYFA